MSFADKLGQTPRREKSGETGYERYDYQASWGLALIFESHSELDDYAIAFEFHDDIVRLNSSSVPTSARFYQVKTKLSGRTLTELSKRKKSKDGTALSSFIGKMYDNYLLFPDATERLSFVSNLPCEFVDASATVHCFANCEPQDYAKFLKKLKVEYPAATDSTAKLLAIFESEARIRFALHFEVKQPTDRFKSDVIQSRGYPLRAQCWANKAPTKVLPHHRASTGLFFSDAWSTKST